MAIENVEDLDEWYLFTAAYSDGTNSNARNPFNNAAAAANPLFDAAFTDEAIDLFEAAGFISNNVFSQMLNAVRNATPTERLEQSEGIQAQLLDGGTVPTNDNPENGDAYEDGGFYLKDTNPNANENAFLAHWAKAFGIKKKDAADVLTSVVIDLEDIGAINSDYDDYAALAPISVGIPDQDDSHLDIVFPPDA